MFHRRLASWHCLSTIWSLWYELCKLLIDSLLLEFTNLNVQICLVWWINYWRLTLFIWILSLNYSCSWHGLLAWIMRCYFFNCTNWPFTQFNFNYRCILFLWSRMFGLVPCLLLLLLSCWCVWTHVETCLVKLDILGWRGRSKINQICLFISRWVQPDVSNLLCLDQIVLILLFSFLIGNNVFLLWDRSRK